MYLILIVFEYRVRAPGSRKPEEKEKRRGRPEEKGMEKPRRIAKVLRSIPTIEGAGVRLRRAFGYRHVPALDPFLLLDDFHSANPEDYRPGFPWHPHRGIETITLSSTGRSPTGTAWGTRGSSGPGMSSG